MILDKDFIIVYDVSSSRGISIAFPLFFFGVGRVDMFQEEKKTFKKSPRCLETETALAELSLIVTGGCLTNLQGCL